MKLHPSQKSARNAITGYGEDYIAVNGVRHTSSLIVLPDRVVEGWQVDDVGALDDTHARALVDLKPELVLIGTGEQLHFPDMRVLAAISAAGIGFEVMDTKAACRTYNILSEEGRNVAALLLIPRR